MTIDTDVCIVGGGISAAMLAQKLSELKPGVAITIVEAGTRIFDFENRAKYRQRSLDYGENAAVWTILSTWPAVGDLPAHLGGVATVAKRTAGLVAYLVVPLLLLTVGLDRLPVRTRAGAADSSW